MGKNSKPITVPGGTILKVRKGKWLSNRWGSSAKAEHTSREAAVTFLSTKSSNREHTMPVKVKTKVKAKTSKAATKAKATKAKPASKREHATHDNDALRKQIATRLNKGEAISDIATALHITAGKAAYLNMLNVVEDTPSLRIKGRNDEELASKIVAAREKQDEHSSWGWLSARAGVPEARVKKLAEEAGAEVKGTHVAKERAAAREAKPKTKAKVKGGKKGNPSK
jgi:hypothetical protein